MEKHEGLSFSWVFAITILFEVVSGRGARTPSSQKSDDLKTTSFQS